MTAQIVTVAAISGARWVLIGVVLLITLAFLVFVAPIVRLWIQALSAGVRASVLELIGMRLRKVDPKLIVLSRIQAVRAGLTVTIAELEIHYLAGGDVVNFVRSLIAAKHADIRLDWQTATAVDLAGRDILAAVEAAVTPRVIRWPNDSDQRETIDAITADGVELKAKPCITVCTNMDRFIGGAGDETVIADVAEGIAEAIGAVENHEEALRDPSLISEAVLAMDLDAGTSVDIVSIDIVNIRKATD